jgi:hypothetical protein
LLQHLSQIAGVYDHDSRCFDLTAVMPATSNLFEPVPVPIEAIEIADIFGPLRLDFIESGVTKTVTSSKPPSIANRTPLIVSCAGLPIGVRFMDGRFLLDRRCRY